MNLLDVDQISAKQINDIFVLADSLRLNNEGSSTLLAGKTFVLFFPETSIRTRVTFEKGIKELGGECILFPPETLDKREALRDLMNYLNNWVDGIIVRHSSYSIIQELAAQSVMPVINAMTSENHPCEILSDLYTISRQRENFRELAYTFVGPPGNICRSWANVASVMNLQFNHVCAQGYQLGASSANYKFHTELEDILVHSDVILTDSLPMDLQSDEYISKYQITLERMKMTKSNAILNPCPPFFRGEEVSGDAISSDYFVGYSFKKNLLYVQLAIVLYCLMK
ncbi:ornithine carbamoyltransferase [Paenibacillus taihuensis]|uniref:Ornithine carbamoyltransferase n=1 Tax=Paenibacillus taihuensis TaxID=1156355 RepID=A0A3D9QWA8_9BACL|nr:ornithine carbamoyltransferase [Paenibacillus taihuensis]REE69651.1 ornithine carbamoyltransferase [Paenibacillus taihuensis]